MMKKIAGLILATVFFPGSVLAAPNIAGVSGTITHSSPITISGSGFGTKTEAKPWRWDRFESGAIGNNVGALGSEGASLSRSISAWTPESSAGDPPKYSNTRFPANATRSMRHNYSQSTNNYHACYSWDFPTSSRRFYATWWQYSEVNVISRNWKMIRVMGTDYSSGQYFPQTTYGEQDSNWNFLTTTNSQMTAGSNGDGLSFLPRNTWMRMEVYQDLGTLNNNDGVGFINVHRLTESMIIQGPCRSYTSVSGNCSTPASGLSYILSPGQGYRTARIAEYFDTDNGSGVVYTTDAYIDDTQARVELGDQSAWSACKWRDIQPTTSWNNGEIKISLNRGRFSNGITAYLYVVDQNGAVNANGYPVTIGSSGGGDTITPRAPGGLSVR